MAGLSRGDLAVVSVGLGMIMGGALAGAASHETTRLEALKLVSGKKITVPHPAPEGLQIEFILKRGDDLKRTEIGGAVYFDLMPHLRKLRP